MKIFKENIISDYGPFPGRECMVEEFNSISGAETIFIRVTAPAIYTDYIEQYYNYGGSLLFCQNPHLVSGQHKVVAEYVIQLGIYDKSLLTLFFKGNVKKTGTITELTQCAVEHLFGNQESYVPFIDPLFRVRALIKAFLNGNNVDRYCLDMGHDLSVRNNRENVLYFKIAQNSTEDYLFTRLIYNEKQMDFFHSYKSGREMTFLNVDNPEQHKDNMFKWWVEQFVKPNEIIEPIYEDN